MNILLQHIRAQRRVMDRAYHQDVKTLKEIERVSIRQFKNHIKHMERVVREKLEENMPGRQQDGRTGRQTQTHALHTCIQTYGHTYIHTFVHTYTVVKYVQSSIQQHKHIYKRTDGRTDR